MGSALLLCPHEVRKSQMDSSHGREYLQFVSAGPANYRSLKVWFKARLGTTPALGLPLQSQKLQEQRWTLKCPNSIPLPLQRPRPSLHNLLHSYYGYELPPDPECRVELMETHALSDPIS